VKLSPLGQKCLDFENDSVRRDLLTQRSGRAHICHAGFVEWVVPVFGDETLQVVLFAGIRSAAPDLQASPRPLRLPVLGQPVLKQVSEAESVLILEHLRQLAARLKQWTIDCSALIATKDLPKLALEAKQRHGSTAAGAIAQRQTIIRRYIINHHTGPARLAELADVLGLTESRTSHVVRETCGQTFRELLTDARLRTAMGLLRHSAMPVLEIGARSGFEDLRHFHRLFKRTTGVTPHQYRKRGE
jgi:AraC-like DNA-binding protein